MKLLIQVLLFLLISFLTGCSNNDKTNTVSAGIKNPEIMYSEALNEFESQNYDLAIEKFHEIELKFPLSKEVIQSQIMIAFIHYIKLEYDLAVVKLEKIIQNINLTFGMRSKVLKKKDGKHTNLTVIFLQEGV